VANVELLRRIYEALNEGEFGPLEAALAPGFAYHSRAEIPGGGTYRGRDVCMDRLRELREVFKRLHWQPEDFLEVGARIMVTARLTGAGRTSGVDVEELIVHVWTFDDGHAVELHVFSQRRDALRALGLPAATG
jgi:ketosteroid isomerase-like protein